MQVLLLATALCFGPAADDKAEAVTFRFAKDDVEKLPAGWKISQTGEGKGSEWKVVADKTTPSKSGYALAQLARSPSKMFNLCIADKTRFKDITLAVKLKAIAGKTDQGGGLVWRYQDAENYYTCRYNPLEDNFRLYKVVKGKRIQLATRDVVLPADRWHTLSVTQMGTRITCTLNGEHTLEATDEAIGESGKVGLWTKADAHTHFEDFSVKGK